MIEREEEILTELREKLQKDKHRIRSLNYSWDNQYRYPSLSRLVELPRTEGKK